MVENFLVIDGNTVNSVAVNSYNINCVLKIKVLLLFQISNINQVTLRLGSRFNFMGLLMELKAYFL